MSVNQKQKSVSVNIMWDDTTLAEAGLDKQELLSIARRIKRLVKDIKKMGLACYSDGNAINIHQQTRSPHANPRIPDYECVIISISGPFDGGDW